MSKKSILRQIRHLSFDKRQSIEVRTQTLAQINKIIGAAMYHNSEKVTKSDIFAYAVEHLYNSVMNELHRADLFPLNPLNDKETPPEK